MKNLFHRVPLQHNDHYHVVVEIPKNSKIKYEYNEDYDVIAVDRVFKLPMGYPENYGFFPQAWNKHDKDPMDALILSNQVISPQTLVCVRIVGIIEMEDTGELDHKIITVLTNDEEFSHIHDVNDIPPARLENLTWFLEHYKDREDGKQVKVLGVKDKKTALSFLKECSDEYKENHQE